MEDSAESLVKLRQTGTLTADSQIGQKIVVQDCFDRVSLVG